MRKVRTVVQMKLLEVGLTGYPGGMETFVLNYNREVVKNGITFDYVMSYGSIAYENEIRALGATVHKAPNPNTDIKKYIEEMTKICKGYDAVSVNMLSAINPAPLIAARNAGVPTIIAHAHSSSTDTLPKRILHTINKKRVSALATDFFACSQRAASWLFTDELFRSGKVHFVKNAVNSSVFAFSPSVRKEVRRSYMIPDDAKVICHVGRHSKEKNVGFLIDTMAKILEKDKNVFLILVGDGVLSDSLFEKVRRYGIENRVRFTGHCVTPERIYSTADFFCLPSLFEGLSISAVEAQASGLKCFISDRVSEESALTPRVTFLPINDPYEWAIRVLDTDIPSEDEREFASTEIRRAGFNVAEAAREYTQLLLNADRKNREKKI